MVDIKESKKEINKKPWWYLFIMANIFVLIGCAITYAFFKKIDQGQQLLKNIYVPTLVCNLISFALLVAFIFFEYRDIVPKMMHFQKKWIYFYMLSIFVFVIAIIFSTIFFIFLLENWAHTQNNNSRNDNFNQWMLIIYLGLTIFLSLASIGINRYVRFKIDLDVYRRRHGQNPNN